MALNLIDRLLHLLFYGGCYTVEDVARLLDIPPSKAEILLRFLLKYGFVSKEGGYYRISEEAKKLLQVLGVGMETE